MLVLCILKSLELLLFSINGNVGWVRIDCVLRYFELRSSCYNEWFCTCYSHCCALRRLVLQALTSSANLCLSLWLLQIYYFLLFFALTLLFLGVVPYTQDCSASFAPSACILFHSFPGLSHDCRWRCTLQLRLHLAWDACCESLRQAPILSMRLGNHFSLRAPLCDYFSAGAPLLGASSRRRHFQFYIRSALCILFPSSRHLCTGVAVSGQISLFFAGFFACLICRFLV